MVNKPFNASSGSAYPDLDLVRLTLAHLVDPAEIAGYIARVLANTPFVADRILAGRQSNALGVFPIRKFQTLDVTGETEVVAPLAEYPLAQVGGATVSALPGSKEGFKTTISDEVAGQNDGRDAVNALNSLLNKIRIQSEAAAMQVIKSAVAAKEDEDKVPTFDAGKWTSISELVVGLMDAQTAMEQNNKGFNPTLFVLSPNQYSKVIGMTMQANRIGTVQEAERLIASSGIPTPIRVKNLGNDWKPLLIDPQFFGTIGHWVIPSPEYTPVAGTTIEVASNRAKSSDGAPLDGTVIQIRKTDTPYVEMPDAALSLEVAWS